MNLSKAIETIRPSIVQIILFATGFSAETQQRFGRPFLSHPLGTGFLVHQAGYVVTANHVIDAGNSLLQQVEATEKRMVVGIAHTNSENMRGNFSLVDFALAQTDSRHDLALLRPQRNPIRGEVHSGIAIGQQEIPLVSRVPDIDPSRPREGLEIGISGYPLSESVLLTNSGHIASVWATDIADLPVPNAPEWFRLPDIADRYFVDAEANPGNSGGPVYLVENASVIGVCIATKPTPVRDQDDKPASIGGKTLFYSSGLTIVVPAHYVLELLKRQNAAS